MKSFFSVILIFTIVFIVYFIVGTNYTLKPKWALDYFNLMAQSLVDFRLDIVNSGTTYDLSYYEDKWYAPWGLIPALIIIPLQFIKGQHVPTFYLSIFFSSLNSVLAYMLLVRIKKEFFPNFSKLGIYTCLTLLTFGTAQFYVGTLGSVWHVDQITTSFLQMLGVYIVFRKERKFIHYFLSIFCFGLALLGRPTMALLALLPIILYIFGLTERRALNSFEKIKHMLIKEIFPLCTPLIFFSIIFFFYNYIRFDNIFEYGFSYIHESAYLEKLRQEYGPFSLVSIPRNLWYMTLEVPSINMVNSNFFSFNLNGNSIFFLTPPFLAIFLALPIKRKKQKLILDPYIFPLWTTTIIVLIPSLMHYASGWIQLGYRYSLDVNILLILLSIFGIKGNVGRFYILGTIFSVGLYVIGIRAFM